MPPSNSLTRGGPPTLAKGSHQKQSRVQLKTTTSCSVPLRGGFVRAAGLTGDKKTYYDFDQKTEMKILMGSYAHLGHSFEGDHVVVWHMVSMWIANPKKS